MYKIIVWALAVLVITGCSDSWEGFVYPNRNNLAVHRNLGKFKSLEMCRAAAKGYLDDLKATDTGDYECGKNCDDGSKFLSGIKMCEETLR
jgi:hypothetical protein